MLCDYDAQRQKLTRDHFGQDEIASLDLLEAEVFGAGAGAIVSDERDGGWQRSSLNSDDDPPHLRLVTAFQVSCCFIGSLYHI